MKTKSSTWQDVFQIIASLHSETKIIILHTIHFAPHLLSINEIVNLTKLQRSNISKQLKELLEIGVLKVSQEGRQRFYQFESTLAQDKREMIKTIVIAYQNCDCSNGKLAR